MICVTNIACPKNMRQRKVRPKRGSGVNIPRPLPTPKSPLDVGRGNVRKRPVADVDKFPLTSTVARLATKGGRQMKAVKFGFLTMAFAIFSMIITIPLNFGIVSGAAFILGMLVSWVGGLWILKTWLVTRRN